MSECAAVERCFTVTLTLVSMLVGVAMVASMQECFPNRPQCYAKTLNVYQCGLVVPSYLPSLKYLLRTATSLIKIVVI
jgi:hypothetical protein